MCLFMSRISFIIKMDIIVVFCDKNVSLVLKLNKNK